jgi:hypothetical protein
MGRDRDAEGRKAVHYTENLTCRAADLEHSRASRLAVGKLGQLHRILNVLERHPVDHEHLGLGFRV